MCKKYSWDSPGGPVIKNPPSNAGDMGLIPGWGTKIPHATGQLSLHAKSTESVHSRAHVPQLESPCATTIEPACSGAHTSQLESPCATTTEPVCSGARASQLESPCAATTEPARSGACAPQLLSSCALEPECHN